MDFSQTSSLNFIVGPVANIIERNFPFRFGVVPIIETEEGKTLCHDGATITALISCYRDPNGEAFLLSFKQLRSQENDELPDEGA
jgi:hypothetical protein